jgi:hypothetical protein
LDELKVGDKLISEDWQWYAVIVSLSDKNVFFKMVSDGHPNLIKGKIYETERKGFTWRPWNQAFEVN